MLPLHHAKYHVQPTAIGTVFRINVSNVRLAHIWTPPPNDASHVQLASPITKLLANARVQPQLVLLELNGPPFTINVWLAVLVQSGIP
jgi:hypothetical protein